MRETYDGAQIAPYLRLMLVIAGCFDERLIQHG